MTGPNMKSALYLKNTLKTDPLTVTPSIYLANGVRYTFPPVTLAPSGTAVVDINQSLGQQGVASYAELYGYAEIEYQWPWAPVTATVRNVDAVNSLIFMYPLQQPPEAFPRHASAPTGQPAAYELEGLWWKQEKGVSGFIALANVTGQEVNADVRVTDNTDSQISSHHVTVSPHGTKMLLVDELKTTTGQTGGVYLSHDGDEHALAVSGGLRDPAVGYSARLPLLPTPQQPATGSANQSSGAFTSAELGLMTGAADPMMNFPSGTVFTPYSIIRNISDQSVSVTPTIWWMAGGTAHLAQVPKFTVAPHRTMNLNVPNLLTSTGLNKFSGSVNVVLDSVEEGGALVIASGSVDEKNTYVFEVMPHGIGESASKAICYWSTGNGDDTMVTLWNPADEAQDLAFTLFYAGGQYVYPVPLGPRETRAFNVSEILHSSIPDATGNIIPAGITEGSAEIAGSLGEHQHILIGLDAAIYNVRKAICSPTCVTCNGITSTSVVLTAFSVAVNGSRQQTFYENWNTGNQYNMTSQSNWSSSATSVMTVNNSASKGAVIGVAPGSGTISAADEYLEPIYEASYCTPGYPCPNGSQGGNTGGTVPNCPTSVSIAATTNIRLEDDSNFPTYKTGIGISASMQPGPVRSVSYNQSKLSEALSVNGVLQNTCPSSWSECNGSSLPFTVGQSGTVYNVPFPATNNIFYDQHVLTFSASALNQAGLSSCTYGCNQIYYAVSDPAGNSCGNANIAGFTIIYNFTKDTIQGTPVTRTSVTKQ
jgi:hypothetical protein